MKSAYKVDRNNTYYKDCLCINGLDSATIDDLIKHKTTIKELIDIQIKKFYRFDSNNNANVHNEERREEVMSWLKMEGDPQKLLNRVLKWWSEKL